MYRHEVHAVLGVRAHGGEQVVGRELHERLLHVADRVVHGDGAHHERRLGDELLAEAARLARVGEVHDRVGAVVLGDLDLLPLLGGVRLVTRDAQVHVHLGGEALAHAHRVEPLLDVADVRRDGDTPVGHALADVFRVAVLALGDGCHLRGDLPRAGEVHLRDEFFWLVVRRVALRGVLRSHTHAPFVGITHIRFLGSEPARSLSACRVLQAPRMSRASIRYRPGAARQANQLCLTRGEGW